MQWSFLRDSGAKARCFRIPQTSAREWHFPLNLGYFGIMQSLNASRAKTEIKPIQNIMFLGNLFLITICPCVSKTLHVCVIWCAFINYLNQIEELLLNLVVEISYLYENKENKIKRENYLKLLDIFLKISN